MDKQLARCLNVDSSRPGRLACYGDHLAALKREQTQLIRQIQKSLSAPPPEAVDYEQAKVNLKRAQAAWLQFYDADCQFGSNVFGAGNGSPEEELDCNIRHFESRNSDLKRLYRDFLAMNRPAIDLHSIRSSFRPVTTFHYAPQPNCGFNADASIGHRFAILMTNAGALQSSASGAG